MAELEECIPAGTDVERQAESRELAALISSWLRTQSAKDRALFIKRYWHGESISSLSEACGCRPGELSLRMFRLRKKLKAYLEKEGFEI